MPYSNIDKPSKYFNTITYTGTGVTSTAITGVGFQPDFLWVKIRSGADNHVLVDAVRGSNQRLFSNLTNAESGSPSTIISFDSNGFTLGTAGAVNGSSSTYVAWNWLGANTTVSNTSGTITSTVSANTTSGFSIVSYTGNGSSSATVGHGLGVTPAMVIIKERSNANYWNVKHKSLTSGYQLYLEQTVAQTAISGINGGGIANLTSSSTFGFTQGVLSVNNVNLNSGTFIAYCFAEVKGFSKFGSYTGNGSTDGTFVYTGFKPAFIIAKKTDTTSGWGIFDNKRTPYNVMDTRLLANTSGADDVSSDNNVDFVSNGIKFRSSAGWNASASYIYMAFAENPFVSSKGIPTTAR